MRSGASIRTKRIPDDAQWREPSEDKITRRRAQPRAIWTEQWDTNHTAPITDVPTHRRRPYPRTLRESAHATRVRARYAGAIRKRHRDNLTRTRQATESPPEQARGDICETVDDAHCREHSTFVRGVDDSTNDVSIRREKNQEQEKQFGAHGAQD